jgi:hypothetical protein
VTTLETVRVHGRHSISTLYRSFNFSSQDLEVVSHCLASRDCVMRLDGLNDPAVLGDAQGQRLAARPTTPSRRNPEVE